jgi:putative Holliday junction resolvase
MKYLGVDYGSKSVGIAISDDEGKIAFPRAEVPNDGKLLQFVARMAEQEKVGKIIIGDTLSWGGEANTVTPEMQAFTAELARAVAIPSEFAYEAGSSIEASRYAPKGQEHNNAAAAALILQRYLDMHAGAVH